MSKKFKSQASSSRAASGAISFGTFGGFSNASQQPEAASSSLSYISEPPDLSQIFDPQIVVTFKNLLKKDSTTKAKGLEELQSFITAREAEGGTLEDGLLEAWATLYPRTSIDSARRVRQLAHTTQGHIVAVSGRRIARHIPKVVGAWLAGLYDNDKLVQRTAQDSIDMAFATEEKKQGIWKVYQLQILDFVIDAVLHQTPLTLSDERSVSPDEADAKYARVVGAGIQLFDRLLAAPTGQNLPKDSVETLVKSKALWKFAYHDDPSVRRSLYGLLDTLLSTNEGDIDWKVISTCLLSKAISISQRGSATAFSALLLNVTQKHPQIWTTEYSGKTSATKRLLQYVKTGSQGASNTHWANLYLLLRGVPSEVLHISPDQEEESTVSLITAFHEGILNREEPKANIFPAWSAYVNTVIWISGLVSNKDKRQQILHDHLSPIATQYVLNRSENSQWTVNDPQADKICTGSILASSSSSGGIEFLQRLWSSLTECLIHELKLSPPELSHVFKASQDAICTMATRFFHLESMVVDKAAASGELTEISSIIQNTTVPLLQASFELLRSRNGKPYSAAAMLNEAVVTVPAIVDSMGDLEDILSRDIPDLIFSPSAERLVSFLFRCRNRKGFEAGFERSINVLFDADQQTMPNSGLQELLSHVKSKDIESHERIKSLITSCLDRALQGDRDAWAAVIVFLQNQSSKEEIAARLLRRVIDELSLDARTLNALHGLNRIVHESEGTVRDFAAGPDSPKLFSKLLYLSDSPVDEISSLAVNLERSVKGLIKQEDASNSTIEIIQHDFENVGLDSLSLDSLVNLSKDLLSAKPAEVKADLLSQQLLPTKGQWEAALQPFLHIPPNPSSSLISPLAGAVYLVDRQSSRPIALNRKSVDRDYNQFSLAFRLAYYTTKLLCSDPFDRLAAAHSRSGSFLYFPLAIQLIADDLNIAGSTGVVTFDMREFRDECAQLVTEARLILNSWLEETDSSFVDFWEERLRELKDDTAEAYRTAEAFVRIVSEKDAMGKLRSAESSFQFAEQTLGSLSPFILPATVAAYGNSIAGTAASAKLCNRLIADLTGLDALAESEGLRRITALNLLIRGENSVAEKVPTQRLVFFVKHLVQCLQSKELSHGLSSETFKALAIVLPFIKEIYGSHWSDLFDVLESLWESSEASEEYLPVLHSSFRLFACLKSLATGESNDDLEDAWIAAQKTHPEKLIHLLPEFDQSSCIDLPWNITTDLLARQISAVSMDHVKDVSQVFSALSIQNRGVQRAAYEVLHRVIPKTQETVSFDVALSNTAVNLPDELLSLLLEVPNADLIFEHSHHDNKWIETRCYLLSWKTIFDHFIHASIPVRERYTTNIKENECLPPLLEFMFDFLQGQRDKLIDASKFPIRTFEVDQSESAEKETQWLLVHLYYLCLKYLPNPTRAWWMDSKKRIKGPIEAWTQKYITPFIIEDSLNDVSGWFSSQDWINEEQPLSIKISRKVAEIVASIEIDEESPPTSIAISLPTTYPLQQPTVIGRYRVVVDEKKWKGWLLTIQGVIMFSNGNLVDGLMAFRRNVQGALKGQGECTICCSIISTNMQTPDKRCGTCKQTFHSDCLYRWFKSSNSSSCPLCRNNFLYS